MLEVTPITFHNDQSNHILRIDWSDGTSALLSHAYLREQCRCAECRASRGIRADQAVVLTDIKPVGSYGIQLVFSDLHERGIYPFSYLLELIRRSSTQTKAGD